MTKKHFIRLAQILRDFRKHESFDILLDDVITMCKEMNPRFNTILFRRYVEKED